MSSAFEDEEDAARHLIDLKRERCRIHARNSGRQAEPLGIVLRVIRIALFEGGFSPGEKRHFDPLVGLRASGKTSASARHIANTWRLPRALRIPQIRMTIRQSRRRRNVRAVLNARNTL